MTPPYAILHRLSVEDGYGNTPHVRDRGAVIPSTTRDTMGCRATVRFTPFRLGFHLDTPAKIEHA